MLAVTGGFPVGAPGNKTRRDERQYYYTTKACNVGEETSRLVHTHQAESSNHNNARLDRSMFTYRSLIDSG